MISGLFSDEEREVVAKELNKLTIPFTPFLNISNLEVGGDKNLECDVFVAAFGNQDYDFFIDVVKSLESLLDANCFDLIQVFVKNQNQDYWSVYRVDELNEFCFV